MMQVLIPMAGAGSRFSQKGYTLSKPVIPTTSRHHGRKIPMVVAAVEDLPAERASSFTFVVRDFHGSQGVTAEISRHVPGAQFITVSQLTEGQASTCLLAKDRINNTQPLLIAACDNGMDLPEKAFARLSAEADALIFTFRGNDAVLEKPEAYGWVRNEGERVTGVSIKQPISSTPLNDHAICGTFWFRHGQAFVAAAEAMLAANDRINGEFYVDQVFKYALHQGLRVKVLEISRYFCWGTPEDYAAYENTLAYWHHFVKQEAWAA